MVGLKDVAEKAKVSVSTVSYVLNGQKRVKDETYERIMDAVKETGYVTERLKRHEQNRRRVIGMVLPDAWNQTWGDMIDGAERFLEPHGYEVICVFGHNNPEQESKCLDRLLRQRVAGVIFAGMMQPDLVEEKLGKCPVVHLERTLAKNYAYVDIDHKKASQMAIEHLLERKRTHIAFISGPLSYQSSIEFLNGVTKTLFNHGICYDNELVCECKYNMHDGYEAMLYLLGQKKSIDAVFTVDDEIAAGAIQALHNNKIRVPEDIAVVGFCDYTFASIIQPPLTTLRKPSKEMGMVSAEIIWNMIRKSKQPIKQIKVCPKLVIREST